MLSDLFCKFSAMLGIMRHRIIPILLPPIPGQHGLSHNSARSTGYKAYPLKTRVSLFNKGIFILKRGYRVCYIEYFIKEVGVGVVVVIFVFY